jgi:hypothetical protein
MLNRKDEGIRIYTYRFIRRLYEARILDYILEIIYYRKDISVLYYVM